LPKLGPIRPFRMGLALFAAMLALLSACPAGAAPVRQILVINSYHPGYKWSDDTMHGLIAALHQFDPEALIQTEYLDTKRNNDPAYFQGLPACLESKYGKLRTDLVICTDESAFFLMLEHGGRIFPGTPTVFCGVNTSPLPPLPRWMTGVHEDLDLPATIDMMRTLQPDLREIVAVCDRTSTGLAIETELRRSVPQGLTLKILDDLPLSDLVREAGALRPDQGLLFLIYFRDRNGTVYGQNEAVQTIAKACRKPVFGAWRHFLGHGLFGGYLLNGYEQGRMAGTLAGRILSGERPEDIPVVYGTGVDAAVDAGQMERFGIRPNQLPETTHFYSPGKRTGHEILVLNSYHTGFKWTDDILAGIRESLQDEDVEADVEFMDTKRHPEPEFEYLTYIQLREKYRDTKFSVVVTSDDNAFDFARRYRQALFRGAPLVFCGVNYLDNPAAMAAENITGVLESYDILSTVQAAARMVPKARRLLVINDSTPTGVGNHKRFEEIRPLLPPQLEVEMLENVSMTRLLERLPNIPADSVVLLMSFNKDRDGNTFSYEESCSRISTASPVPVFSFWDFYLGHGSVGGMVTSGHHQGFAAGQLVRTILHGTKASQLPVITRSPNAFIFDAAAMRRHPLDRRLLPAGATLINDDDASTKYSRALWTISFLVALIAAMALAFLLLYRLQRRKRQMLERSVRIDPLTGAFTRSAFESEVPLLIRNAQVRMARFVLCYVDVDKLKQVNDTFGHIHGDTYLKNVVAALRASIRSGDDIFRIGGDEFVVIFPGCGLDEVQRVWDVVNNRIRDLNESGSAPYAMGITHGCAEFDPQDPQDLPTLLRQADQSMYLHKTPTIR